MPNVTFYYKSGASYLFQVFNANAVKGLDSPESVILYNRQHEHLDGSIESNVLGFKRRVTIDLGVLQDNADKKFLLNFVKANDTYIATASQTATVVPENPELEADWLDGIEFGSRYILDLVETTLHREFLFSAEVTELMYLKKKVKIEGTQAIPETFTTNVGKLATMETGASYPVFSAATHVFTVDLNGSPYQDGKINIVGTPSILGGNITFQAAVSDAGNASGDGFFYADIKILLQVI